MRDNLFSAVLTFGLLAAGTLAVGSELMGGPRSSAAAPTARAALSAVRVVSPRQTAVVDVVTLPRVTVTGRRDGWVALETHEAAPTLE
ncbi:MAG: hypothetical protein ABI218_11470 [Caldimonas sp.]